MAVVDYIKKDADEQSIYSLVSISLTKDSFPDIRQESLTVHYLSCRGEVERIIRETLDRYATTVDAEEFEDVTELVLSELIPDNGEMGAVVNLLDLLRDWANEQSVRHHISMAGWIYLWLGRADARDALKFKSVEVEENEEE